MNENDKGRTIRELLAPDVCCSSFCIDYSKLDANLELKAGLIHLLSKFHGFACEDPIKHLKEFHIVCSSMKPRGASEEHLKLRAFPFSLDGAAKDWLYNLPPACITSWDVLWKLFLEKFSPASRMAQNGQQFGTRLPMVNNRIYDCNMDQQRIESKVEELSSIVKPLTLTQMQLSSQPSLQLPCYPCPNNQLVERQSPQEDPKSEQSFDDIVRQLRIFRS